MIDSPSQTYKITIMNIPAEHENRSSTVKSVIMHKVRMLEDHTISRKHLCVIRYFTLTCSKVESKSPESSSTSNSASFFFICIFYKIKSISLFFHIPTFVDCQLVRLWRVDMIILVSFVFGFVLLLGFYSKSSSVCCLILLSSLNPFTSTCRLTRWSCRRRGCRIATSGDC